MKNKKLKQVACPFCRNQFQTRNRSKGVCENCKKRVKKMLRKVKL